MLGLLFHQHSFSSSYLKITWKGRCRAIGKCSNQANYSYYLGPCWSKVCTGTLIVKNIFHPWSFQSDHELNEKWSLVIEEDILPSIKTKNCKLASGYGGNQNIAFSRMQSAALLKWTCYGGPWRAGLLLKQLHAYSIGSTCSLRCCWWPCDMF